MCAYQEVKNVSFSENFAYVLNERSLTKKRVSSCEETADLVTFTEEILNGKLHFLHSELFRNLVDLRLQLHGNYFDLFFL